jgi:hypothetical protein
MSARMLSFIRQLYDEVSTVVLGSTAGSEPEFERGTTKVFGTQTLLVL